MTEKLAAINQALYIRVFAEVGGNPGEPDFLVHEHIYFLFECKKRESNCLVFRSTYFKSYKECMGNLNLVTKFFKRDGNLIIDKSVMKYQAILQKAENEKKEKKETTEK